MNRIWKGWRTHLNTQQLRKEPLPAGVGLYRV